MRATVAAVVSLAWSAAALCQQPPELLTLDHAIALALQQNRLIKNSSLEVRKLEDRLAEIRTYRLPSFSWYTLGTQQLTALDFRFPAGAFGVFPGIGPVPPTDTAIHQAARPAALLIGRIDQPLSQQYRINLNLQAAGVSRQIAQQQERAQKQDIINQVKRAYYGILQTQAALESAEESIRLYRELDRVTEDYVRQQVALQGQGLDIKTRLAKAEYDALTLRNPLATQKEQLNNLLGRDIRIEFRIEPVPESSDVENDLAAARKRALEQRPEVRQARLKVRQAEYDRRAKKSEYIPDVSLSFNYLSPVNYGSIIPTNIAGVGLLLNWEPFDWGRKHHELAEKIKTVEQASLTARETESQIEVDVGNRLRRLQEARQLLAVMRLGQETARENLRVIANRYRQQASLLKDVLQAQTSLSEANTQFQRALMSFWSARADFEKALGEDQ